MKNKQKFLGLLVLAAVLLAFTFTSCEGGGQSVKLAGPAGISTFTIKKGENTKDVYFQYTENNIETTTGIVLRVDGQNTIIPGGYGSGGYYSMVEWNIGKKLKVDGTTISYEDAGDNDIISGKITLGSIPNHKDTTKYQVGFATSYNNDVSGITYKWSSAFSEKDKTGI